MAKSEPTHENISIRKIDNGFMVSHSKSHEGKDGSMGSHESKEMFMAKRPKFDVGSMKDGARAVKEATSGGKKPSEKPKAAPKMDMDKKGEKVALGEDKGRARLPSGKPDKAVRKVASTGGPVKGQAPKRNEQVMGEKKKERKKPESMADFAKRRDREARRK